MGAWGAGSSLTLIKIRWQRWLAVPCQMGRDRFFLCRQFSQTNDEIIGFRPTHPGWHCSYFKSETFGPFNAQPHTKLVHEWVNNIYKIFTFPIYMLENHSWCVVFVQLPWRCSERRVNGLTMLCLSVCVCLCKWERECVLMHLCRFKVSYPASIRL